MPTIDRMKRAARWLIGPLLAGCAATPRAPEPAPGPARPAPPVTAPAPQPSPAVVAAPKPAGLPAPKAVRTHEELRRQAAERLVMANPEGSFMTQAPTHVLSVVVLEVEVKSDGSVRRVNVVRKPRFAPETLQLAIDAIHRAAPFGDVRRMPEPWKFTETFLFEEDRRFKPLSLN
ncbi:outer membrane biosynthesis protein TonB [Pelomonas saccharophila]|uniref:Outer membrane biosynthesis protein TonB n=1 Tax=Roseateles saccharophilus TaxID=304 RepID=A0ABU1YFU3_ROSSA|nr:hypothetical protein [Roseateles saccharophilus]MDR7267729.1 outer membrane biosynthesis protein TonB [Roseateles saccharophilus]